MEGVIDKIGADVLAKAFPPVSDVSKYSGRIGDRKKLLGRWNCDIYKSRQKLIPYIRLFKGRKKIAEIPITRTISTGLLIASGMPTENVPQIIKGIYDMLSCLEIRENKKPNKTRSQRLPKEVKYV